jgi:hypothetical protein
MPVYSETSEFVFHKGSTAAANGNVLRCDYWKSMKVEIFGSSANSARTITFYRKSRNGTLVSIPGFRTSDFTQSSSTTALNEEWVFDLEGGYEVVMDLTAITGGSVSVVGTLVA